MVFNIELFEDEKNEKNVVNSARVSFDKRVEGKLKKRDKRLIKFLVGHAHISTLFHNIIQQRVERTFISLKECLSYMDKTSNKYHVVRRIDSIEQTKEGGVKVCSLERFSLFAGLTMGYFRDKPEAQKGFETCFETWTEEGLGMLPVKGAYTDIEGEMPIELMTCSLRLSMPFAIKMQFFKSDQGFRWTEKMPENLEATILNQEADFSQNEVSRRYVDAEPDFALLDEWHYRPEKSIKQGAGVPLEKADKEKADKLLLEMNEKSLQTYNELLNLNVAPEEARFTLTTSSITHFIQTGGLLDWARIHYLRSSPYAQKMIRDISSEIDSILTSEYGYHWERAKAIVAESYV